MVSMKTKPVSEVESNPWEGKPVPSMKNEMAAASDRLYGRATLDPWAAMMYGAATTKILISSALPDPKPYEEKLSWPSTAEVIPIVPEEDTHATKAKSGTEDFFDQRSQEVAYNAWLEAFTTFYHDDRLTRIEHGTRVDETGKVRTKRTAVAKQFVTWLLPGDRWGLKNPDGTARLEGDYPTRDRHEKSSDNARYNRSKVTKGRDLTLVPRQAWSHTTSREKPVAGFETWSRPPTLGELFAQHRRDAEAWHYIKPITWHQQWLDRTICFNMLDASTWGPTPQEREGAVGNLPVNPVARQYRLSVEEPIPSILDEHVKAFEMLNVPTSDDGYVNIATSLRETSQQSCLEKTEAANDSLPWEEEAIDLSHYGTPLSPLEERLETGKEIISQKPVWIYNDRKVMAGVVTPLLRRDKLYRIVPRGEKLFKLSAPIARNEALAALEIDRLRAVSLKAKAESELIRLNTWLEVNLKRGDPRENDKGFLKTVQLTNLRAMFRHYRMSELIDGQRRVLSRKVETPNCVRREHPRCSFVDDNVRYNSWWLTAIASDGIPDRILVTMTEAELIKLPFSVKPYKYQGVAKRPYDFVDYDNEQFANSFEYWVKMVKMGKSPLQALKNAAKRIGIMRARSRAYALDQRPKPLADNITLKRREAKVTERVSKAPVLLTEYSPKEIASIISEERDKRVEPVIGHLVSSPKFQERARLDHLLSMFEREKTDIFTSALFDGAMDPDSLVDSFSYNKHNGLYVPAHRLETISPDDWKGMGMVSEPRITLLDKVKKVLHQE